MGFTEQNKPTEQNTTTHNVTVAVSEEKKPEKQDEIETIKEVDQPTTVVPPATDLRDVKEVENTVPKSIVKFSLDVVEHAEKSLPFAVLLVMQRETLTMQTARVMGAKIYTVGSYKTLAEVEKIKEEINELGVTEATIIGSINNIKVTQKEAEEMLKKTGQ